MLKIELPKESRAEAVASLRRYFDENLTEALGEMPAGLLLNYFLEEIGPAIYNRAVAEAQARIELRLADLSGELYIDEYQYWPRLEKKRKGRK